MAAHALAFYHQEKTEREIKRPLGAGVSTADSSEVYRPLHARMNRVRSKRALVEVRASAKRLTTTSNLTTSPPAGVLNEGRVRIVSAISL
jgi:hypothetical protein